MAELVYILCTITSLACTIMLARGYLRTRTRLLLWSALCFAGLTLNNLLLYLDLVVFPRADFSTWRSLAALGGIAFLVYGMIWDVE